MCAIAGILGEPAPKGILEAMLRSMARRGPDGSGIWQEGEVSLLHTRLAIIDPAGGAQPMALSWEGETYTLVYNGELYNTEELRRELTALGHCFRGHSDTEVVLHSYAQWKEGCLDRFNGIFAFAVWEKKGARLFLARDRMGVKPLFYAETPRGVVFASEIKTILAHPAVKPELDREGAAQILLLGPGRMPGSGVFRGIRELEPGCWASYARGKLKTVRYWKLRDREHTDSLTQTLETVRYLVTDAIRGQMVSDVPIGTFLSGGLDSSLITAVCAGELTKQGQRLKTFSVDYLNNDRFFTASKFQPNSDAAYIRIMQQALGTEHHLTILTPEDLAQVLEEATQARDLPGMADVDFSLLAFCGEIRREVKVALSGECADELFGGYPWYRDPEVRSRAGFPWAQNTALRASLLVPEIAGGGEEYVMDAYRQTCRESDILPGTSPQERRMKEMMNLNVRWFMQTLLDRKDRMSMYHGLEVRVPFCDCRIAEYLYGVPWELKDLNGQEKGLLRTAMEGVLPEAVLHRKKSPYPKTFDPQYTRIMEESFRSLLVRKDRPIFSLVRREVLRELGESPWPWYGQLMGRPQTLAWFLQLDYWLEHYQVALCF